MKYWLVTFGFKYPQLEHWRYTTSVIKEHPGNYCMKLNDPERYLIHIVFAMPISRSKYFELKEYDKDDKE